MGSFDDKIHLTFLPIKHIELNQMNQNGAECRLCVRRRGNESESLRVAAIMRGESGFSVSAVASSWLLVAAAQPQGHVTVN